MSAGTMFLVGQTKPELGILRWAALADAVAALGFTVFAIHKASRE
jgi:hypothetical protein